MPTLTKRRGLAGLAFLLLLPAFPAPAAVIHLDDGSRIRAAVVGEADGVVTFLDDTGESRTVERARIVAIDESVKLPETIERRARKARGKFVAGRRKEAWQRLLDYRRAEPAERGRIRATLVGYRERELLDPLVRALVSKHAALRELALEELERFRSPDALVALAIGAVASPDRELGTQAHERAVARNPELTRTFYELVATAPTTPEFRVAAIDHLAALAPASGPDRAALGRALLGVIEGVRLEAGVTRAEVIGSRSRRLTLGNTRLDIELPVLQVFRYQGTVSTRSLRPVEVAAWRALQTISGYDYGEDTSAWKRWLERMERQETPDR